MHFGADLLLACKPRHLVLARAGLIHIQRHCSLELMGRCTVYDPLTKHSLSVLVLRPIGLHAVGAHKVHGWLRGQPWRHLHLSLVAVFCKS